MSVETLISISILLVLTYFIWRLNRTPKTTKTKVRFNKKRNNRQRAQEFSLDQKNDTVKVVINNVEGNEDAAELPTEFLEFQLLFSDSLDDEQTKTIERINQSFCKPHPLLIPLMQDGFEPNELFDLIKTDAEITAKILNIVNSPLFSLRQTITNINHAIIFLGITQVKNIALQLAVQDTPKLMNEAQKEAYKKLWRASYLASSFCLLFATEMNEDNPSELSTHCLLSYLGDLAILSYQPSAASCYLNDSSLFERTKTFQNEMGINSAIVGKFLAQQWQLPKSIEIGIEYSLSPLTNDSVTEGFSTEKLRHTFLCYISCRLGDLFSSEGLRDLSLLKALNFETTGELGFYFCCQLLFTFFTSPWSKSINHGLLSLSISMLCAFKS